MTHGFKRTSVLLTPAQYEALRAEAKRRAAKMGGLADASAILRELVDRWMEETKSRTGRK